MSRIFNVNGACNPKQHYMVDLSSRLEQIKKMIDNGSYFTITKGRQYGKTTTLLSLFNYLRDEYEVIFLDFQNLGYDAYMDESAFSSTVASSLLYVVDNFPDGVREQLETLENKTASSVNLQKLFQIFGLWCRMSEKPIVLLIDEVDTASNNQVFLDFLAQLRSAYLSRYLRPTFQSVILAGLYDVRNIKRKIRPEDEHKVNSSWNTREGNEENASLLAFDDCPRDQMELAPFDIAADFLVDMNFQADEIAGMLEQYEADNSMNMNVSELSKLIYDYTSGYPVLVSSICKFMDERLPGTDVFPDKISVWTTQGVEEAVKILLTEKTPLFESLLDKLNQYPEMKDRIYTLLFQGEPIPFNIDDPVTDLLHMFGFVKNVNGQMQMANRIFEVRIYNYFLMTAEASKTEIFQIGAEEKNQFIRNGQLDMDHLLAKFIEYFDDIYGDRGEKFVEDDGRRYFMLFLKPIINGTGNYYVEARTRNRKQTDLIIDYKGKQFIVEMKIWRGNEYNERGEAQLSEYLDYYHLDKGYMLSFCFNKNKQVGMKEVAVGDKLLVEAVV